MSDAQRTTSNGPRTSSVTHDCPHCDGILPREAVTVTDWTPFRQLGAAVEYRRRVSMKCPHCGLCRSRWESKTE